MVCDTGAHCFELLEREQELCILLVQILGIFKSCSSPHQRHCSQYVVTSLDFHFQARNVLGGSLPTNVLTQSDPHCYL